MVIKTLFMRYSVPPLVSLTHHVLQKRRCCVQTGEYTRRVYHPSSNTHTTTYSSIMANVRHTMALRDTTLTSANMDERLFAKQTALWGGTSTPRLRVDATPKSTIRPLSSIGTPMTGTPMSAAANGMTDTPKEHSSTQSKTLHRMTPRPVIRMQPFGTPQRSLFNRYLLREVDVKPSLTVVLDLDETLVSNRRADLAQAILRPYALHVLNALRHMHNLEIVLWTASTKETGSPVVDQLYEGGPVFDDIIFRNDSWFTEPYHTKDLTLLGRDMDRVVVFDNAPNCCKYNPENSVLVEDFVGARVENDAALVNCYYIIESLLKQCNQGVSVREGLSRLVNEGHLCRPIYYKLPDNWSGINVNDHHPLKVPPHGKYYRAHTLPPNEETMRHWTI